LIEFSHHNVNPYERSVQTQKKRPNNKKKLPSMKSPSSVAEDDHFKENLREEIINNISEN